MRPWWQKTTIVLVPNSTKKFKTHQQSVFEVAFGLSKVCQEAQEESHPPVHQAIDMFWMWVLQGCMDQL